MINEEKAKELAYNNIICDGSWECLGDAKKDEKICIKCMKYHIALEMAQWKDKQVFEKILKWFQENLQPHTDWTGTRIETRFKCESLDELFNLFKKSIE